MEGMMECGRCGSELSVGAKFCGACGAAASSGGSMAPLRKYVCVLFVDIVGSTGIAEATDPEVLRGMLSSYFRTVSRAVWQFGGTVEKFIGDAVMAVFGVPAAHEDDALRAVKTAIKIIDDVAALRLVSPSGEKRLEVRIGINAGEVFVAHHPDGQFSVTGDIVNVASRLQARAHSGETYIGQAAADLVAGHVDLEFLGETVHKGKSRAEGYYRLTRNGKKNVDIHTMSFVGRDRELRSLAAVLESVTRRRQAWLITLVGDAGQGKSRLLHELLLERPDVLVLRGSAQPASTSAGSFAILDEVLATVSPDWPAYVRQLLGPEASPVLHRLESAVGRSEGHTSLEDVAWALGRVISRIAIDRAVCLVWDDLHWASDLQLDLVQLLTHEVRQSATLTLCLTRPELFSLRPWWGGGLRSRVEPIEALNNHCLEQIATEWHAINGGKASRIAVAVERCDGNPLVLRMLLESKDDAELPMTVHALFGAILDRLEPSERAFCEAGAVFGRKFNRDAAAWVMDAEAGVDLDVIVRRLTEIRLLEFVRNVGESEGICLGFSQSLLMQEAYMSVPKALRSQRHVRAADWLIARKVNGGESDLEVFAHLHQALVSHRAINAASAGADELLERVIRAGLSALARQSQRGDPALVATVRRLTAIIPDSDERLIDVLLTVWLSRSEQGGERAFRECLARTENALQTSGTWTKVRHIPEWMDALGSGQLAAGDCVADAIGLIEDLRASAATPAAQLFAYFYIAQIVADMDDPVRCMEYVLDGAKIARICHHAGAERAFMSGALQSSLASNDTLHAVIELAERIRTDLSGVRRALPMVHGVLAAAYALCGDLATGHEVWDAAADLRENLSSASRLFVEQYFCDVLVAAGELSAAARRYAELAEDAKEFPANFVEFQTLAARFFFYARDFEQARRHLDAARSDAAHVGAHRRFRRRLNTLDAALAAVCGEIDQARALLDGSSEEIGEPAGWLERGYAALDLAIAHDLAGNAAQAALLRDESIAAFRAKGAAALAQLIDAAARLGVPADDRARIDAP